MPRIAHVAPSEVERQLTSLPSRIASATVGGLLVGGLLVGGLLVGGLVVTVGEEGGDVLVAATVDDAGADVLVELLELHAASATAAAVTHSTER